MLLSFLDDGIFTSEFGFCFFMFHHIEVLNFCPKCVVNIPLGTEKLELYCYDVCVPIFCRVIYCSCIHLPAEMLKSICGLVVFMEIPSDTI